MVRGCELSELKGPITVLVGRGAEERRSGVSVTATSISERPTNPSICWLVEMNAFARLEALYDRRRQFCDNFSYSYDTTSE